MNPPDTEEVIEGAERLRIQQAKEVKLFDCDDVLLDGCHRVFVQGSVQVMVGGSNGVKIASCKVESVDGSVIRLGHDNILRLTGRITIEAAQE